MKFVIDNWLWLVIVMAGVVSLFYIALEFKRHSMEEQLEKVKEWLLYAVTCAEAELGGGTGKLKLRYVYDMFLSKFGWMASVITFAMFSTLVEEAVKTMKDMLETNKAAQGLIDG